MPKRLNSIFLPESRRTGRALSITLGGFAIAFILALFTYYQVDSRERTFREFSANSVANDLQSRIRLIEGYVFALSGYYTAERDISSSEFTDFAKRLSPVASVRALQFIRAVNATQREEYLRRQRLLHGAQYAINDRTEDAGLVHSPIRARYLPIEISFPIEGNEASLGLDITSNPSAYATLMRASKSGLIAASESFPLVQDHGERAFSLYGAVFNPGDEELAGAVSALVSIQNLVASATSAHAGILEIYDTVSKKRIYEASQAAAPSAVEIRQVVAGDANWTLRVGVSATSSPVASGLLVFGVVLLLTLLALGALDFATLQAAHVVVGRQLNESEQWLQQREAAYSALFYNSATANAELDPNTGKIMRSNTAFDLLSGYTDQELSALDMAALMDARFRNQFSEAFNKVVGGGEQSSLLEFQLVSKSGDRVWVLASLGGSEEDASSERRISLVIQDIRERKEIEAGRDLLVRELAHRLRNTMQLVTSLAEQSAYSVTTIKEYRDRLRGRLRALSVAQDALFETNWTPVQLDVLVKRILEPFQVEQGRRTIDVSAPAVTLEAQQAQTIALALHELANNAVRHGALAYPDGQIELSIELRENEDNDGQRLDLRWVEMSALASFAQPSKTGFGSVMLEKLLARQYGGEAKFDWQSDRMIFSARLPFSNASY